MAEANAGVQSRWRAELSSYISITLPFSFFPLVCVYLMRAYDGYYLTIPELVGDGGVLPIAIVLAAESLARLVASGRKWRHLKVFGTGFSAWVIGGGSIFSALRYVSKPRNPTFFVNLSFVLLAAGIVISTLCRFLPEDDR
jgi:hypothetical protein